MQENIFGTDQKLYPIIFKHFCSKQFNIKFNSKQGTWKIVSLEGKGSSFHRQTHFFISIIEQRNSVKNIKAPVSIIKNFLLVFSQLFFFFTYNNIFLCNLKRDSSQIVGLPSQFLPWHLSLHAYNLSVVSTSISGHFIHSFMVISAGSSKNLRNPKFCLKCRFLYNIGIVPRSLLLTYDGLNTQR